jgi:hypothetical protein
MAFPFRTILLNLLTNVHMNNETEYLQRIAEEIAAINNSEESTKPDHHLVNEADRLEKIITHSLRAIENFTQRDTFHFGQSQCIGIDGFIDGGKAGGSR